MNWKWNGVYLIFFFSYISLVSLPMPMGIILFSQSPSVPIDSLTESRKLWPAPGVNAMQYASSSSCSHLKASESNTLDPGPCFMINPYPPPPPQFHDQSLITPPPPFSPTSWSIHPTPLRPSLHKHQLWDTVYNMNNCKWHASSVTLSLAGVSFFAF